MEMDNETSSENGLSGYGLRRRVDVFLALEGGGARGLVHVGALSEIEGARKNEGWPDLRISGVAGTSAGAIVASLVAAGYKSDELIDRHKGNSPLLDKLGVPHASALFGPNAWGRIKLLRMLAGAFGTRPRRWLLLGLFLSGIVGGFAAAAKIHLVLGPGVFLLAFLTTCAIAARWMLKGLCSTEYFAEQLDRALQEGPLFSPSQECLSPSGCGDQGSTLRVRFRDLQGIPLRIVATDIDSRELKLFSEADTPETFVADAVAASVALPIIFEPPQIGSSRYYDGGLVSNLPAWTFDAERELNPDSLTVAVEIPRVADIAEETDVGGETLTAFLQPFRWAMNMLLAAISGGEILNKRMNGQLEVFTIDNSIDLLDFDMTPADAKTALNDARRTAHAKMDFRLFQLPATYQFALRKIHEVFDSLLAAAAELKGECAPKGNIRVNTAAATGATIHSLAVTHHYSKIWHSDDRMILPLHQTVAGLAYRTGEEQLYVAPFPREVAMRGMKNRYRRALLWKDVKWSLSVPIFTEEDENSVRIVLNIDSDLPIDAFGIDQMTEVEFRELIQVVEEILQPSLELEGQTTH